MKNVLVILGNGFDLDLGLKTRYSDFWQVKCSAMNQVRFNQQNGNRLIPQLINHIEISYRRDNWFDLEETLRNYVSMTIQREETNYQAFSRTAGYGRKNDNGNHDGNAEYFNILKAELVEYLEEQQKVDILNEQSCAVKLLKEIATSKENIIIYNFNYTDVNDFASKLGLQKVFDVRYIHGSLKERNIVLGIGDDVVFKGYEFLLKTEQNAKGQEFIEQLFNADEVICFGMAFGFNDIQYFRDYFMSIQDNPHKPSITIYTKDDKEFNNIIKRLKESKIDVNKLRCHANLHFEPTCNNYPKRR